MAEYIDRDALLERLRKVHMDKNPFAAGVQFGVEHAIQCTEEAPAADVVEVRHGYWIDHHSGGSFCSACKRWVPYSHHPKYCETCGTRMDKEDEHEAG